jgi:hypothetical protein
MAALGRMATGAPASKTKSRGSGWRRALAGGGSPVFTQGRTGIDDAFGDALQ